MASASETAYQEPVTEEEREGLMKRAEKLRAELEEVEKRLGMSAGQSCSPALFVFLRLRVFIEIYDPCCFPLLSGLLVCGSCEPAERTSSRVTGPDQSNRTKYEFLEALALPNDKVYEIDFELLPEKPWRKPGANLSDYFNYGFDEDTWRAYCSKQIHHRLHRSGSSIRHD